MLAMLDHVASEASLERRRWQLHILRLLTACTEASKQGNVFGQLVVTVSHGQERF